MPSKHPVFSYVSPGPDGVYRKRTVYASTSIPKFLFSWGGVIRFDGQTEVSSGPLAAVPLAQGCSPDCPRLTGVLARRLKFAISQENKLHGIGIGILNMISRIIP